MILNDLSGWVLMAQEIPESDQGGRDLGLRSLGRHFNNLAVPGLGQVRFLKPIFWSCLGIALAEKANTNNPDAMRTVNAIEALSCWLAVNNGETDSNYVLGKRKLANKPVPSYKTASSPGFYLDRNLRQMSAFALRSLGLVNPSNSSLFASFTLSSIGYTFLDYCLAESRPYNKNAFNFLGDWVSGQMDLEKIIKSATLYELLSPITPLPLKARGNFMNIISRPDEMEGLSDKYRRRQALKWVALLHREKALGNISWDRRPPELDPLHWQDMSLAADFNKVKGEAVKFLENLEREIASNNMRPLELPLANSKLEPLRQAAREAKERFVAENPDDRQLSEALAFYDECLADDAALKIVLRDGGGLRLSPDQAKIHPGQKFKGRAQRQGAISDPDNPSPETKGDWPPFMPQTMIYLYNLNLDLTEPGRRASDV